MESFNDLEKDFYKDFNISKLEEPEFVESIHLVESANNVDTQKEDNDIYVKDIFDDEYSDVDDIKSFFAEG